MKTMAGMVVFVFAACIFLSGIAGAGQLRKVLVVSIDALHPDAIGKTTTPVIFRVMGQGACTMDGRSTDPPLTLIAHTAMFTGLGPTESGKTDNEWRTGMPTVDKETIFDIAKSAGFSTGYFYSKEKLGYLVNDAVDTHRLSTEFSIEEAHEFLRKSGRRFVFLHIGGLDRVGPASGWLSPEYMEEMSFIDEFLEPLIETAEEKAGYLIVVTSDHAGHGTVHGSRHPDDFKLPLVIASDRLDLTMFQDMPYNVADLKTIMENLLGRHRLKAPRDKVDQQAK